MKRPYTQLAPALIPLLGLILGILRIATQPFTSLASGLTDDAYYYLRVAQNVVHYGIVSFDGIHATTGFHPLWQLIVVVAAYFVRDAFGLVYAALVLNVVLVALAGLALFAYMRSLFGATAALIAQVVWSLSLSLHFWQLMGMENVVYFATLPLFLHEARRLVRPAEATQHGLWRASVAGILLIYARTDTVILVGFVVALMIWAGWRDGRRDWIRAALGVGAAAVVAMAGYLGFNYTVSQYPFQVSAAAKMLHGMALVQSQGGFLSGTTAQETVTAIRYISVTTLRTLFGSLLPGNSLGASWPTLIWWLPLGAAFALSLRSVARAARAGTLWAGLASPVSVVEIAFVIFVGLETLLSATVLRDTLRWTAWYLVPQILLAILLLGCLMGWQGAAVIATGPRAAAYGRVGLIALAFLGSGAVLAPALFRTNDDAPTWIGEGRRMGAWIREHVPAEARIGAWDTGLWAYYSERPIVNLDGLMNDYRYLNDYLRAGRVSQYVDDEHIDYLITWTDEYSQCRAWEIGRCLYGEIMYRSRDMQLAVTQAGVQVVRLNP